MTFHRTRSALIIALVAVLTLAACGDDTEQASSSPAAAEEAATSTPADSPYCRTALEWQVHELSTYDESDPAALNAYVDDWVEFVETAVEQAPPEIADDWAISADGILNGLVPIFERYDYDLARMEAEGTPEEAALFGEPPADVQEAQEAQHEYEALVCGAGQPPAADVTFTGPPVSRYCEATDAFDDSFGQVALDDPDAVRAFMTDEGNLDELRTASGLAPEAIAEDEAAQLAFVFEEQLPLIESYDYDFERILLEGSPAERAVFQYTDPAVSEHAARIQAYAEQVCGAAAE